jgi:hypothetical protein
MPADAGVERPACALFARAREPFGGRLPGLRDRTGVGVSAAQGLTVTMENAAPGRSGCHARRALGQTQKALAKPARKPTQASPTHA